METREYRAAVLSKLLGVSPVQAGTALVWATQEAAVTQLSRVPPGHAPDDSARAALACIQEFEERIRNDSALVLGIGFVPLGELE
eukprot:COSAG01_NODE_71521_length_255_cov_1.493590_1_plen_84_part_11